MRWTPDREWLIVAYGARPYLDAGMDRLHAVKKGQRLLPKSRRATEAELIRRTYPSALGLDRALAQLELMSPEQIAELLPEAPPVEEAPRPVAAPAQIEHAYLPRNNTRLTLPDHSGAGHPVKWTPMEWALLARRTRAWQAAGSNAGDVRCVAEAQEIELPEDRRRPYGALSVHGAKVFHPNIERGLGEWAHLIEHIPYNPLAHPMRDKYETLAAHPRPEPQEAPSAQEAPLAPPEAAAPPAAPLSPLAAPVPTHEEARVFGISLANALVPLVEQLLARRDIAILARVREEQRAHGEQLATDMSRLLLEGMDRMLGGSPAPVAPPVPVVEGPNVPVEGHPKERQYPSTPPDREHPQSRKLRVDVVGFEHGHHKVLVQQRLDGDVDVRFVHPDTISSYQPQRDRHVILLTSRVPHTFQDKVVAAGCQIHWARRTVSDVVEAVTALVQAQA